MWHVDRWWFRNIAKSYSCDLRLVFFKEKRSRNRGFSPPINTCLFYIKHHEKWDIPQLVIVFVWFKKWWTPPKSVSANTCGTCLVGKCCSIVIYGGLTFCHLLTIYKFQGFDIVEVQWLEHGHICQEIKQNNSSVIHLKPILRTISINNKLQEFYSIIHIGASVHPNPAKNKFQTNPQTGKTRTNKKSRRHVFVPRLTFAFLGTHLEDHPN